ncbi:MAG TPA: hypothetical protein VJV22_20815, partial [Acidobacteriaceae bacterium]|nr:hypothetical protein [Acidobacteriaceae bacterium]
MTLITGIVNLRGAIHVSDRLTTLLSNGRPFDPLANKTIIYLCDGAVVTIGYTGIAYISGRPTDVWIAEQLVGQDIDPRFGFGQLPVPHRNIYAALELLRNSLERELKTLGSPHFALLVT